MGETGLTIREIKAQAVVAPLKRPIRTAVGAIPAAPLVLIDVATNEGISGRSYLFAYTTAALAPLVRLIEDVGKELRGLSPAPRERMREFDVRFRLLGWQGLIGMMVSGLDMAFWDAQARAVELPVAALLGGRPAAVPAYDSYGIVDPVTDEPAIRASVEQGFRAIKIKIGDKDVGRDVATVAAVRKMIGPDVRLMVDYNQSLDPLEALRRIERLAEYDLDWVEEPVRADDIHGHAKVRAGSSVPIQTGENWWFPRDLANAVAAGASDLAMFDVMKIGGVSGWLSAMGHAAAASLPVSSHIFVETSAHLLAVTPTAHWLEYSEIANAVLTDPSVAQRGLVTARGPGLGIDWDENAIARYSV